MNVEFKILDPRWGSVWPMPERATEGSVGLDLRITQEASLLPDSRAVLPTGIAFHIRDPHVAMLIVPRSGYGKLGLILGNAVGTIDPDYQGEIQLIAWNSTADTKFDLVPGERIAQALFIRALRPDLVCVSEFSCSTDRGEKGLGSSGSF